MDQANPDLRPAATAPSGRAHAPHRGRHIAKRVGLVLLGLFLLLLVLIFLVPKTAPGQGLIDRIARPRIEAVVAQQLGSEVDYAGLRGALPGELVIEDIALSEGGQDWLRVERVRLDWSPLSLIRGDIVVEELAVTNADLLRPPPPRPPQPEPEETRPLSLPSFRLDRFSLETLTLREPVLGEAYVVSAFASARGQGQEVDAEARLGTASGTDEVTLDIAYDPETLTADVTVRGDEGGLLAELSQAGGPIAVRLDGEGPLSAWAGSLEGEAGQYGGVTATLTGDLQGLSDASFDGVLRPGPALPPTAGQLAGDALDARLSTARDGEAVLISIDRIAGRFGTLQGEVALASPAAERVEVDVSGMLSEVVAAEFGAGDLAGPISLKADAAQDDETWRFDGTLGSRLADVTVTDGVSGGEVLFAGDVAARSGGLTLGQERLDPILEGGLTATARVRYPSGGAATVQNLDLAAGEGARRVTAKGEASFAADTQAFTADLDLTARRGAMEAALGTGSYQGPLEASLAASGTPQDARATLSAALPAGQVGDVAFGEGQVAADFAGLPGAPTGTLSISSEDGSYGGEARVATSGTLVEVPALSFQSNGLNVEGQGRVDRETLAGTAQLSFDAGDGATLVTGQRVAGTARLDATIAADRGPVDIAAQGQSLRFEDIALGELALRAQGPLSAIAYDARIGGLKLPSLALSSVSSEGVADVSKPQREVVVRALRVATASEEDADTITLLSPATVGFGETVSLSEARLDWLGDGTVTAEGQYAPDLWVAEVRAAGLTLPGYPIAADLDLSVDTREAERARFTATALATPEDGEPASLEARGVWAGDRLSTQAALSQEGTELATADVSFPVVLTRTGGALSVTLPEEGLDGTVRYDGGLSPLYAFVPGGSELVTGQLDAQVALSGAVTAPAAKGSLVLADGRFEEDRIGVVIQDVEGRIDLDYSGSATALDVALTGAGVAGKAEAIRLGGTARLDADGSDVDIALTLDEAQLADSAALEVRSSADLTLTGSLETLKLAGTMTFDEFDAAIPEIEGDDAPDYVSPNVVRIDGDLGDRSPEEDAPPPPPFKVALDLKVEANNALFVRGRGLDSEWRTDIAVTGDTTAPVIGGDVQLLDGTFDFAGREFDLTEGRIMFDRSAEVNPRLAIAAMYDTGEVEAIIRVTGRAKDPDIALTANPPLPQEDVLALILFGKQPTELSALETLQIANAVASLSGASPFGGGGPGVGDKLRSGLGLDALSLGVDPETGAASVGVGKYITDDLYVSARQSAGDVGTEVIVTYEVNDLMSVESALKPNGAQSVAAKYKKDY